MTNRINSILRPLLILAFCTLLLACSDDKKSNTTSTGGGGTSTTSSSSGGASSGGGTSTNPGSLPSLASQFAGTYRGSINVTASAPAVGTRNESFPVTAVVNNAGVLSVTSEQIKFSFTLNENGAFNGSVPFNETDDDITCTGTLSVSGNIRAGILTANVSGPISCTNGALTVDGTFTGNIHAS